MIGNRNIGGSEPSPFEVICPATRFAEIEKRADWAETLRRAQQLATRAGVPYRIFRVFNALAVRPLAVAYEGETIAKVPPLPKDKRAMM